MCLLSDAELYCVRTKIRSMSELMQFEMGMSTSLYLPPSGTAGFERCCVRGDRRVPAPPPRITARMFGFFGGISDSPGHKFLSEQGRAETQRGALESGPARGNLVLSSRIVVRAGRTRERAAPPRESR